MNASKSFKLIMLSSTIKTLIGGTDPSNKDVNELPPLPACAVPFVGVLFLGLRGLDARGCKCAPGVGGVLMGLFVDDTSDAGGVGRGGAAGTPFGLSEDVVESDLCLMAER